MYRRTTAGQIYKHKLKEFLTTSLQEVNNYNTKYNE